MSNSNNESKNELSQFSEKIVNQANERIHDLLTTKFVENDFQYLIIPGNNERVDLRNLNI